MRKSAILSGVALSALMLATAPAAAISLNIGGDGGLVSVDTGSSGSSGGGDSGGSGSSDGDLLDLNGNGLIDLNGNDEVDAAVEVDLGLEGNGTDGIVDLDTGGDSGVIVDLFGEEGAIADVELGLDGDDGIGNDGLVDLDTGGDNGVIVDLFGEEGAIADVELGLDGDDGTGNDGLVDLDSGGDALNARLFGDGSAVADVDLGLNGGDGGLGSDELVDVNGDGSAAVNAKLLGGSGESMPFTFAALDGSGGDGAFPFESRAAAIDLFGGDTGGGGTGSAGGSDDGVDDTATGSIASAGDGSAGGDGLDGDDGTGAAPAGGPALVQPVRPLPAAGGAASVRVATATTGSARCFSPDQGQIAHLLARNNNGMETAATIDQAEDVKIVPINLCDDARARLDAALAADADLGVLQSAIASDADVSAALEPSYQPDDVMAADQSGEDLTVYVY